jgi:hypothetical protein
LGGEVGVDGFAQAGEDEFGADGGLDESASGQGGVAGARQAGGGGERTRHE